MSFLSKIFHWGAQPEAEEPPPPPVIDLRDIDKKSEAEVVTAIKAGLAKGANPNGANSGGETTLNRVCYYGMAEAAKILLEAGADVNGPGGRDTTPLMQAAASLNPDLIELLVSKGADATLTDKTGDDALYHFVHWPYYKAQEKQGYEARDAECFTLLQGLCGAPDHYAMSTIYTRREHLIPLVPELAKVREFVKVVEKGDTEALKTWLDSGTPPGFGADFGAQSALTYAAEKNNIDMMDILMDHAADIEGWSQGMTPIMAAVYGGSKEAFMKLLYAGADTAKLFTYDRYPDTTLPELADIGKHEGMRAFVENALAHRN
ncbi:MAG: hypothetical protein EPN97_04850, partial [Alphaproteobacteria bacterium]